jgi:hypothetical protein
MSNENEGGVCERCRKQSSTVSSSEPYAGLCDDCVVLEETENEHQLCQADFNRRSAVGKPEGGLVARFWRGTETPNCREANRVIIDLVEGKIVERYDAADPANTNPYYGAMDDGEAMSRKGYDIKELVSPDRITIKEPEKLLDNSNHCECGHCYDDPGEEDDDW